MTTKHTPGPWIADGSNIKLTGKETRIVANVSDPHRPTQQTDVNIANANLIAAAPDLLEALEDAEFIMRQLAKHPQEVASMLDTLKRSSKDARAAIAKAKGEA